MGHGETRTVLFICRHGAAKSVLAAGELRRLAAERGIPVLAEAAGIEPSEAVAPAVVQALGREGSDEAELKPHRVTRDELVSASRVITFNLDPTDLPMIVPHVERWDDVPAVSEDLDGARAAIGLHLKRLVEDLDG